MHADEMRTVYDRYVKGWSNVTNGERDALLRSSIAPGGEYADPVSHSFGPDGLAAVQKTFQRKTPKGFFEVDSFETQNDRALIHWRSLDAAGHLRFPGVDAVIFVDGLLTQVSGFFAKPVGMA